MKMAGVEEAQHLIFAGRYRRIRRLGRGGMARVFLAEDEVLDREVAVKQLPSGAPEEALRRFRREARLGASLNHPHIVSIYDSVSDEDSLLIVMEYVEGESLAERMRGGALPRAEALRILGQVAEALDYAHANGVLHRDVKPSNILISGDGSAKLADLGIATAVDATAITGTGNVIGTLAYLAPERLAGEAGEAAADVYSLATVAFEMLSGRRAHPEKTPEQLLRRVDAGAAADLREADPDAPAAAAEVLRKALSADPRERPASAGELVRQLDAALGDAAEVGRGTATAPLPAPAPAAPAQAEPPGRPPFEPPEWEPRRARNARPLAFAALGLAAALLIGAPLLSGGDDGDRVADRQPQRQNEQNADREQGGGGGAPVFAPGDSTEPIAPEPAPEQTSEQPAVDTGTDPAALNDQGYALIQQGRYDEAIPILEQAVEAADPSSLTYAYALFNLGNALRLAGRPEEAIPILEERLEIPNQTGVVRRELELAYAAAGIEPEGGGNGEGGGSDKGKSKDKDNDKDD